MVVFRMILETKKRKHIKAEPRLKLGKVSGREELPAVWESTSIVLKETAKKVLVNPKKRTRRLGGGMRK